MRTAITIGYPHGDGKAVMACGPEVKANEHADRLRELGKSPTHPHFARIEVWESDGGLQMERKFLAPSKTAESPKPVEAPAHTKPVKDRFAVKA